jgi:hypothetical protein
VTPITVDDLGKKSRNARNVAEVLGISIDKLSELLERELTLNSFIKPEEQLAVKQSLEAHRAESASGEPAPDPTSSGTESRSNLVRTRQREHKGAFEPTRLIQRRKPLTLTPEDRMLLSRMQELLDMSERFKTQPRKTRTAPGKVAVQDLFRPERWIWMDLAEFQARQATGELPVMHRDTIAELAQPLSQLSLVNHTCRICGDTLETPHYRGMLEHVLAGNNDLPFQPNHPRAIKFKERHNGCVLALGMMTEVELELQHLPEGDTKEAARWSGYKEKLKANGGELFTRFMRSEYRPLSAKVALRRVEAIKDNVKAEREMFLNER